MWVSQYFDAVRGEAPLYGKLREVFDADYPPSSLHRLLARLPALLRERGQEQLLVVTTNYDDLRRAGVRGGRRAEFDVVWYEAKRRPTRTGASCIGAPDGTGGADQGREQVRRAADRPSGRWS